MTMMSGDISNRSRTDRRLYFLKDAILLPIVTLGIWSIIVYYRLINRRDEHFRREAAMNRNLVEVVKEKVRQKGIDPLTLPEMAAFESAVRAKEEQEGVKGAALWLILVLVTSGIAGLYVLYFLTRDFYHHEQREVEVMNKANQVLQRANAATFLQYPSVLPERHFWLNLLAVFVTLGIWHIFWYYRLLSDPNRHFEAQWSFEDRLPADVAAA
jgi:hypothetical protein